MLCKILQTDSIPACQAWLQSASDTGQYYNHIADDKVAK